ncbi:MAG: class I SAM-dependent methyltransferase, partial [Acidobacteria bacterium]|nr:class I SAM-dependent methyltransferase [Acidobacteriota bacterium]
LVAPHYDADYASRGYDADIGFYTQLAVESGGPVLEMGCGTGRVLIPTARAGVRIHGFDLSPAMLELLRRKLAEESAETQGRVSFDAGDIRWARAEGNFALVTAPFRVIQHLMEREDQRAWLRNVRRHLAPGGALCFDVFQPDYRYMIEPTGPHTDVDRVDAASGRRVRRLSWCEPYPATQKMRLRFEWLLGEAVESRGEFWFRWYTRGEIENLLELEGFRITDYWGSFAREPFGEGAEQQVVRAVV